MAGPGTIGSASRRGAALFGACAAGVLAVYFFPFVFLGMHTVPFHWEPSTVTGVPEGAIRKTLYTKFPGHDDSPVVVHYPNAAFTGQSLRSGELPLWNPYVGCGTPALANGQCYPFSPFLWPFYAVPTPWVYTLGLLLGCAWSLAGAYLWLGRFGMSRWQRAVAALLFTLNPFTVRCLFFSNVWAAWWFGWLLWAWDRGLDRDRRTWWLPSVFLAGMVYGGHPEDALILGSASLLYAVAVWLLADPRARLPARQAALRIGFSSALGGLLTAVHTVPVVSRSLQAFTYKFERPELVTPEHYQLLDLLNPRTVVFVSPLLLSLAFAGLGSLARAGPGRKHWAVAALVAASGVLCFNSVAPEFVASAVTLGGILPGIYGRGLFWCSFAALVAMGLGRVWSPDPERWAVVRQLLLGPLAYAALSAIAYWDGALIYLWYRRDLLVINAVGVALLTGAAAVGSRGPRRACLSAVVAVIVLAPLVEVAPGLKFFDRFNRVDPLAGGPPPVQRFVELDGGESHRRFGLLVTPSLRVPDLSPNLAALWRVRDARIMDVFVEKRFAELHLGLLPQPPKRLDTRFYFKDVAPRELGLLGVSHVAVVEDAQRAEFRWEAVPEGLVRAFLAHRVRPAGSPEESREEWAALCRTPEVYGACVLEGWNGPADVGAPDPADGVEWLEDSPSRVRLRARSRHGGILVLLDTHSAGWAATLDGAPASLYPANLAFRGVEVPPGQHEVSFRYRPWPVFAGAFLSAAGWLIAAALALAVWRRRAARPVRRTAHVDGETPP